jgi:hypothetical protein
LLLKLLAAFPGIRDFGTAGQREAPARFDQAQSFTIYTMRPDKPSIGGRILCFRIDSSAYQLFHGTTNRVREVKRSPAAGVSVFGTAETETAI